MNGVTHGLRNVVLRRLTEDLTLETMVPLEKVPILDSIQRERTILLLELPHDTLVMKGDAKRSLNYDNVVALSSLTRKFLESFVRSLAAPIYI